MINLMLGDCLDLLPELANNSVDAVICDPPYGTTVCKWDSVIPFVPMWAELKRIIKPRGAIVLFGSQPFTSALVMSNVKWFRYEWVWKKARASGHLDANRKPLKAHESVCVFYEQQPTYNPQKVPGAPYAVNGKRASHEVYGQAYRTAVDKEYDGWRYPVSVISLSQGANSIERYHPTQKPVALLSYLIRTYTNEGDTVLDFCFGSGTTGVACVETGRSFIGIERDEHYFSVGQQRIETAAATLRQLELAV